MCYLVKENVSYLQYNAALINKTGIIRGSIQRATKLIFCNQSKKATDVIGNIDKMINKIVHEAEVREELKLFVKKNFKALDEKWEKLKPLLIKYSKHPNKKLEKEIIKLSELCWNEADNLVLNVQITTQIKIAGIKIFYIILGINIFSALLVILLVYLYIKKRLEYESSHDSLTDIYNKRLFDKIIDYLVEYSRRYKRPLSLILFDIDHFKKINDVYGHKTGDKILYQLASIIKNSIRKCDYFFRVGGEEFAIICNESSAEGAYNLAEKLRKLVEETEFKDVKKVTISLGVAELEDDISVEEFYKRADAAMYIAKNKGRNRTEIYKKENFKNLLIC